MHRLKIYLCLAVALPLMAVDCRSSKGSMTTAAQPAPAATVSNTPTEAAEGLSLGNKAPEIELNDPSGKPLKLSSLQGSVVLIDFWASWCGPCRHENPAVVQAAARYANTAFKNGKGFKVYSVSLDQNKDAWVKAIAKDSLFWPYHVSDLGGWGNSAAVKYNVNAIPTNVLINGDGIIIGKGLRGEALTEALSKYSN